MVELLAEEELEAGKEGAAKKGNANKKTGKKTKGKVRLKELLLLCFLLDFHSTNNLLPTHVTSHEQGMCLESPRATIE